MEKRIENFENCLLKKEAFTKITGGNERPRAVSLSGSLTPGGYAKIIKEYPTEDGISSELI